MRFNQVSSGSSLSAYGHRPNELVRWVYASSYINACNEVMQFFNNDYMLVNSDSGNWLGSISYRTDQQGYIQYLVVVSSSVTDFANSDNLVKQTVDQLIKDQALPSFDNCVNPVTQFDSKEFFKENYESRVSALKVRISNIETELFDKLKQLKALEDEYANAESISNMSDLNLENDDYIGVQLVDNKYIAYKTPYREIEITASGDYDPEDEEVEERMRADGYDEDENDYSDWYSEARDALMYEYNSGESHTMCLPEIYVSIGIKDAGVMAKAINVHSLNRTVEGYSDQACITPHTVYDPVVKDVPHACCFGGFAGDMQDAFLEGDLPMVTELLNISLSSVTQGDAAGRHFTKWVDNSDMAPSAIPTEIKLNTGLEEPEPEPESQPTVSTGDYNASSPIGTQANPVLVDYSGDVSQQLLEATSHHIGEGDYVQMDENTRCYTVDGGSMVDDQCWTVGFSS